jgi:tripartite ATP-independent transporter DctM subunit
MDATTIGLISIGSLFALILIGFHIGVALMLTSFAGVYFISGRLTVAANLLKSTAYSAVADYVFAIIPLFILMGLLTTAAGATRELFTSAEQLLRRVRGGVGIATVVANAVFAAITGVSVASAAVFSKLAVPEMERLNYDRRFSLGIVASSALLGMLIPPSILMIVYAVLTEQSVGKLFAAGLVPGLLVAGALSAAIWGMVTLWPRLGGVGIERQEVPARDRYLAIVKPWPIYLLIALVLGGIYGGFFTPTEAGAVGAFGALCLLIARGKFSTRGMIDLLLETGKASASIFFLLIAASMYSRMLTLSRLPAELTEWIIHLQVHPAVVFLALIVLLLILGMILDSVSILLLTVPIIAPVASALGYDLIWLGIVVIITVELGLLTPPFGMVVFAMKAALPDSVKLEDIYAGSAPFLIVLLLMLAVIIMFPQLTLFVPNLLFG